MIQITGLTKHFGSQILFNNIDLKINQGEKTGLIGRNGFGKTTLFKILTGEEESDSGEITIPKNYKIGYVKQNIGFTKNTVLEEGTLGLPKELTEETWIVKKTLFGLGFNDKLLSMDPKNLSGGFQIRLNLTKTLLSNSNMLLLDEPTNYLDITSIRWLIKFLKEWKEEFILITHDRSFMDEVVTHIAGIYRTKIKKIKGNTENYYMQIAEEEDVYEKERLNSEKKFKKQEEYIARFRSKARLAGLIQSRLKMLDKMEKKEKLTEVKTVDFYFNYDRIESHSLMQIQELSFSYEKNTKLIDKLTFTIHKNDRIAVIGPNGRGKTTLLKLLTSELEKQSGGILKNSRTSIGYFAQTNVLKLHPENTVEEEISMEDPDRSFQKARNIAGALLFEQDDAEKKIKVLSGGEKSRVALGKIIIRPVNLLLLDEPTNHFDMESSDSLLEALIEFPGAVVMVTHNQMFLHAIATRLIVFDGGKIFLFEGSYAEFLEKIGWESEKSENNIQNKNEADKSILNKKELRKLRAEVIEEKSKIIKPLELKHKKLEDEIDKKEKSLAVHNADFLKASEEGNGKKISELSKLIHQIETEIDILFNEYEKTMSMYDEQIKFFEEKLASLEE